MGKTRPLISIIAAMANNRVIGKDNRLPWRLPADLKHFKSLTLGKPIVMGRNTWESLPGLLPERKHIVVTRNSDYRADGCIVVNNIEQALLAAGDVEEAMIVGGADIYRQLIPLADRMYLTLVDTEIEGDAWFPEYDEADWREVKRMEREADEVNSLDIAFITLVRSKA